MAAGPVGILASGITSDAIAGYQKTRNANPLRSANLPTIDPSEPLWVGGTRKLHVYGIA